MASERKEVQITFSDTFMTALQRLPPVTIARTFEAISRFSASPDARGRNLEKITGQYYSIRVGLAYRAIICEAEQGRSYIFLWVDHHDEAYQWAENRKVIAAGKMIQIIRTVESTGQPSAERSTNCLFAGYNQRLLLKLGIAKEQIPLVLEISDETELKALKSEFHPRIYEALQYLASGIPIDEIIEMMGLTNYDPELSVKLSDTINTPETRQNMISINDELDLENLKKMISGSLAAWRVYLHASQRKLAEGNFNGPVKVIGGAGTGKTIVAIHRAKYIAEQLQSNSKEKILLTTFTVNLAADIGDMVKQICSHNVASRIDVINLDKLISTMLQTAFPGYRIVYKEELEDLWQEAIRQNQYLGNLTIDFFKEEWGRIAIPNRIKVMTDYLQAERMGRGIRLSRKERMTVWSIFQTYKKLVDDHRKVDIDTATLMLTDAIEKGSIKRPYQSIIVDEAQDFSRVSLQFIRLLCLQGNNDLFIVGDAHQRIYRNKTALSQCDIDVRGRSYSLRINYRTTEQIRKWASRLFYEKSVDDLDNQDDQGKGYISLLSGQAPNVTHFDKQNEEIEYIHGLLKKFEADETDLQNICICLRSGNLLTQYKQDLEAQGHRLFEIKPNNIDQSTIPGFRISTMHRVKGLEFDHVIICAVNDGVIPLRTMIQAAQDPVTMSELEFGERCLLYVAATRAKQTLNVTSFGKPSPLL